jgi:hypothetical protein
LATEHDWLSALRAYNKAHGGKKTAATIGYSTGVVSGVLGGKYKGDLKAVQQKVEGSLMGLTVDCPVIGELPRNRCLEYQRRGFAATNPMRVALSKACPKCPNRLGGES